MEIVVSTGREASPRQDNPKEARAGVHFELMKANYDLHRLCLDVFISSFFISYLIHSFIWEVLQSNGFPVGLSLWGRRFKSNRTEIFFNIAAPFAPTLQWQSGQFPESLSTEAEAAYGE